MRKVLKYLLLYILAFFSGCVDPITFETGSADNQVVFFGNFTQLCTDHIFNITQTANLGEPPIPVSGAVVVIMDDEGNSADYLEVEPGKYLLTPDKMVGTPGKSYHLEIALANGKSYFTRPQVMPEPIEVDTIYFEINLREELSGAGVLVEKTVVEVFISTPLKDNSGAFPDMRWAIEEVYSFVDLSCGPFDFATTCYFVDPIDDPEVLLYRNEGTNQEFLDRLKVRSRLLAPFDEFTARHYFLVNQYTISEEESQYWEKIDAVANQSGSLFDVQPAAVAGNIIEEGNQPSQVLGYFGVNGANAVRTFTTPFNILPVRILDCNDPSYFRDHLPECCNCSTKTGIQIERPDYWDED